MVRRKGPGHRPPIPQPNPKRREPKINLKLTFPWGFSIFSAKAGVLLNFIINTQI